jgi:hypothetical protein
LTASRNTGLNSHFSPFFSRNYQSKAAFAIMAVICLLASRADAKYSGGTGEPNNPYRITTPTDLNDIGNHVEDFNNCFILVNDINMAAFTYDTALIAPDTNESLGGFQGTPFTGVFNGNEHIICNLTIDTAGAENDYIGLFGKITGTGEIKDLGVQDVNVTSGNDSGGLGGLCGSNAGTISNCYSTGSVTGGDSSNWLGGLCGSNESGTITRCYATGSVCGGDHSGRLGGLVGATGGMPTISNCYATAIVSGESLSSWVGGLCGYKEGGTISNSYAVGSVTGDSYVGGLCGINIHMIGISNCYFLDPNDGGGPNNGHGTPLPDELMKQENSFTDWDFVEVWNIGENQTYPFLRTHSAGDLDHNDKVNFSDVAILCSHWLEEK